MQALDIDDTFGVGQPATRAELAYALWTLSGAAEEAEAAAEEAASGTEDGEAEPAPTAEPECPFADVESDAAARPAIIWAAEQGLMTGVSDGEFAPDWSVSQEEVLTALRDLFHLPGQRGFGQMKEILLVDCCVRRELSRTARLARAFVEGLDQERFYVSVVRPDEERMRPMDGALLRERDRLLAERALDRPRFDYARQFAGAEHVVFAAPFWDMSFPAFLKVYIENISVEGITFPGRALSIMPRMDVSVGMHAMLTYSPLGPMQGCMMGLFRWVTALTFKSQQTLLAGPL